METRARTLALTLAGPWYSEEEAIKDSSHQGSRRSSSPPPSSAGSLASAGAAGGAQSLLRDLAPPAPVTHPSVPQASTSAALAGTPSRGLATSTSLPGGAGRRQRPSAGCTARTWPASARRRNRTSSTVGWGWGWRGPHHLLSPTHSLTSH